MSIKFLKAHNVVGSVPAVSYAPGQVVDDLSPESEAHFVNRRSAAHMIDGKLYDADGKEVADVATTAPAEQKSALQIELEGKKVDDLKALAKEKNIDLGDANRKDDIIAVLLKSPTLAALQQ